MAMFFTFFFNFIIYYGISYFYHFGNLKCLDLMWWDLRSKILAHYDAIRCAHVLVEILKLVFLVYFAYLKNDSL